ncbi:TetR/AcrR family transcriptional regulator [Actinokineospora iranica]|uniref:TetR/AcrR family transcriptional regulator n=1 Tax=Actinokineospora iranica TaxID=1271860 RepID=UPI001E39CB39|nr:TetR/AcrR family transcriptional regulator [Actinokineospora iranica]
MDGRLARGAETRRLTLSRAAEIASVEGLDGLTLGRLASELRLSKSGIFAHFGSKEDLQLATIGYAEEVFAESVLRPALAVRTGLPRLLRVCELWIEYFRSRVFPGGCFFAAVAGEFKARDGRVHDAIARCHDLWNDVLTRLVTEAVDAGDLPEDTDAAQVVFEIHAVARAANSDSVLTGDDSVYDRAVTAIRNILGRGSEQSVGMFTAGGSLDGAKRNAPD